MVVREVGKRVDEDARLAPSRRDERPREALHLANDLLARLYEAAIAMRPPLDTMLAVIPIALGIAVIARRAQLGAAWMALISIFLNLNPHRLIISQP